MQYLPAVSIITVEAESLTLLCLLALGRWSGALLELSCSLAVCFHRPPAFLKQQRPLTPAQVPASFLPLLSLRARRSAASYAAGSLTGLPSADHQRGVSL